MNLLPPLPSSRAPAGCSEVRMRAKMTAQRATESTSRMMVSSSRIFCRLLLPPVALLIRAAAWPKSVLVPVGRGREGGGQGGRERGKGEL